MSITDEDVLAATGRLVTAFAATDTEAYFACFSPDASFVFHPEAARFGDRATYERVWAGWLADGWRVVSCESTERLVQVYGETGILSHRVRTVTEAGGERTTSDERETIVFALVDGELKAVHEHLSPVTD